MERRQAMHREWTFEVHTKLSGRMRSVKQGGTAGDIHALVPTGNCVGTGAFFMLMSREVRREAAQV